MVQCVLAGRCRVQKHSSTKLTYEDYLLFPDDGLRHEIIEGEHYVSPSPSTRHQRILLNLSYLMRQYLEVRPVGEILFAPFDVLLSEFNVLVPDLIYLSRERSHLLTSQNLQGAPDLAVEILSPSTRSRDLILKRDVFGRTGVLEYWLVDPENDSVTVYHRAGEVAATASMAHGFTEAITHNRGELLTTPLLPGLSLLLDKVLA
jgi:Uma2 family endonuclease